MEALFFDRMLGCLLGSAIGDALGAPVEMWSRHDIVARHRHIDRLLPLARPASPEGPWGDHLPAGSSTDDTRWKALFIHFLTGHDLGWPRTWGPTLDARAFAAYICQRHTQAKARPPHERDWLVEFDRVARGFLTEDPSHYGTALAQFYGGDLTCAGMLYAPMIGAAYPGAPRQAYEQAHALAIFDHGYARDLTGLTAALTAAAFDPEPHPSRLLAVIDSLDPFGYGSSPLIGRCAARWYHLAQDLAQQGMAQPWQNTYQRLDRHQQWHAFHPGEIWLVLLTALQMCHFDFVQSLAFIVNYGRDNDTTASTAGAILGAMYGASQLPDHLTEPTLEAHLALGMDLPELAGRMCQPSLRS